MERSVRSGTYTASREQDTADDLLSAMMRHGEEGHGDMFEGKSPEELAAMRRMIEAHVRRMIIDQN